MLTAVPSSTAHCVETICCDTSKGIFDVTFTHLEVMLFNKCIKFQSLAEGQSPYRHTSFFWGY